ncbi:MAG: sigma-54-dependent Fis family transcriptional regulator, partial [Mesorhizobium sp.]|uniref:helix-turn-helix domain-containing protein n=1 Tax=Mesorhizobium sp. TaxID=1871066 RepID=UPI0011FC6712
DDIPYLVRHFMEKVAPADPRRRLAGISAQALAMLQAYDWPGNIRQLENAVFRASVLAEGDVLTEEEFPQIRAQVEGTVNLGAETASATAETVADGAGQADEAAAETTRSVLSDDETSARPQPRFGTLRALDERGNVRALADVELEMIKLAIDHYNGQMSEVARRLGIGRSTLYRKLKEYGIDPEAGRVDRLAS